MVAAYLDLGPIGLTWISRCHLIKMRKYMAVYTRGFSHHILLSHLQMETVTKSLIKMHPLSTDGAILILVFLKDGLVIKIVF